MPHNWQVMVSLSITRVPVSFLVHLNGLSTYESCTVTHMQAQPAQPELAVNSFFDFCSLINYDIKAVLARHDYLDA